MIKGIILNEIEDLSNIISILLNALKRLELPVVEATRVNGPIFGLL